MAGGQFVDFVTSGGRDVARYFRLMSNNKRDFRSGSAFPAGHVARGDNDALPVRCGSDDVIRC